jgi:hypothetical protein
MFRRLPADAIKAVKVYPFALIADALAELSAGRITAVYEGLSGGRLVG